MWHMDQHPANSPQFDDDAAAEQRIGLAGWTPRRRTTLRGVASQRLGPVRNTELGLLVRGGRVPHRLAVHSGQMMDDGAV